MTAPGPTRGMERCARTLVCALLALAALPAGAVAQRLVAARDLPRNHVLLTADLAVLSDSLAPATRVTGISASAEEGWVTRRVIRAGEPLQAPAVTPRPTVVANDTVTVVWTMPDGIRVSRSGIALGAAHVGQPVLVRIGALRRLRTIAVGPSTVEVR